MYGSLMLANKYFTTKRVDPRQIWSMAKDDATRSLALEEASMVVDSLSYLGTKTDPDQETEFPRDDTSTPEAILEATYEIAHALLDGRDIDFDDERQNYGSTGLGRVRGAKKDDSYSEAQVNGIPSARAWRLLRPYLVRARDISLERS